MANRERERENLRGLRGFQRVVAQISRIRQRHFSIREIREIRGRTRGNSSALIRLPCCVGTLAYIGQTNWGKRMRHFKSFAALPPWAIRGLTLSSSHTPATASTKLPPQDAVTFTLTVSASLLRCGQ